ncbi:hypothetical protein Psi02_77840 [Planotetraspora silvatica]|uniref:Uncharacterized protein n=1 Tax=Planotetraspora silvatica TaxID=234614 RepID=A0A8J3V7C7_9ACTN|nr:hypothetical protein Psi02_77840 [Planotetraspora silvatica]
MANRSPAVPRKPSSTIDKELRALVQELMDDPVEWDCPEVSAHLGRALPNRDTLAWVAQPRGSYRVVEYTCACEAVFYELVSCGGIYQIHKVIQSEPLQHTYAGGWRQSEARLVWCQLLAGRIR